jgi:hypothetical protein
MAEILLLVIVAVLSAALGALGLWAIHVCAPAVPIVLPPVVVPQPAPEPPPPPSVKPVPLVKMRFVSGSGRVLGETTFRGRRPATFTYRTGDGLLSNFVCSTCDDGTWVYRRIGVEREGGEKR